MKLSLFHPMQIVLGLIIWAVWFVVIYGGIGVVCGVAPPPVEQGALTWINGLMLVLGIAFAAYLGHRSWLCYKAAPEFGAGDPHGRFISRIASFVYGFAAVASLGIALPVVLFPPCV